MQDIIYNPTKAEFKAPIGGLTVHNECSINILITKRYNIYNLRLVLENDDGDIIIDKGFNYKSKIGRASCRERV